MRMMKRILSAVLVLISALFFSSCVSSILTAPIKAAGAVTSSAIDVTKSVTN